MSGEAPRETPAAATLADALRARILDGALPGGERLREQALAGAYDVARHTVRAALRALEGEGLVRIEPNRGAAVTRLTPADIADLHAARTVVEVGAVRLALERRGGRLTAAAHAAAAAFAARCRSDPAPTWSSVVLAHNQLHAALVAAAGSPRLTRAHGALSAELALFLVHGRPHFSLDSLAAGHLALLTEIEDRGARALEAHLRASATALLRG